LAWIDCARIGATTIHLIYQHFLDQISAKRKEYASSLQPACSAQDLADLQTRARKELNVEIPRSYTQFLRQLDGLNWNGLFIYASKTVPIVGYKDRFIDGFIDANLDFRGGGWENELILFGDSNLDLYVYDPSKKKYSARDRVSLDEAESYASFEQMLTEAFRKHL
jgi:hypothetical protein